MNISSNSIMYINSSTYMGTSRYANVKKSQQLNHDKNDNSSNVNLIKGADLNNKQDKKKSRIESMYKNIQSIQEQIENVKSSTSSKYADPKVKSDKIKELEEEISLIQKQIAEETKKEAEESKEKTENKADNQIAVTDEQKEQQQKKAEQNLFTGLISAENAIDTAKFPISNASRISKSIDIGTSKMLNNNKDAPSKAELLSMAAEMGKFLSYAGESLKAANNSIQNISEVVLEYKKNQENSDSDSGLKKDESKTQQSDEIVELDKKVLEHIDFQI